MRPPRGRTAAYWLAATGLCPLRTWHSEGRRGLFGEPRVNCPDTDVPEVPAMPARVHRAQLDLREGNGRVQPDDQNAARHGCLGVSQVVGT